MCAPRGGSSGHSISEKRVRQDPRCRECDGPVPNGHRWYCDQCRARIRARRRARVRKGRGWNGFVPESRRCAGPGCTVTFVAHAPHAKFCSNVCHERARRRANPELRGYDSEHRRLRKSWEPRVAGGRVRCARGADCECAEVVAGVRVGGLIRPGDLWDLGHDDLDRSRYVGPEHARCNRQTAKHRKLRAASAGAASREW